MENSIRKAVYRLFQAEPVNIRLLGGGFYGRAFVAELANAPCQVVAKVYLFPGIARKEARQLDTRRSRASAKILRRSDAFTSCIRRSIIIMIRE